MPPTIVQLVGGPLECLKMSRLVSLKENPEPVTEMVIPGGVQGRTERDLWSEAECGGVSVMVKKALASPVSPPLVVTVIVIGAREWQVDLQQ